MRLWIHQLVCNILSDLIQNHPIECGGTLWSLNTCSVKMSTRIWKLGFWLFRVVILTVKFWAYILYIFLYLKFFWRIIYCMVVATVGWNCIYIQGHSAWIFVWKPTADKALHSRPGSGGRLYNSNVQFLKPMPPFNNRKIIQASFSLFIF